MKLYLDNGYLNIPGILATKQPFIFCWGGRATGKTYGALKEAIESGVKFGLMRRTQTQLDVISKPEFSPFKPLNKDMGINVGIVPLSKYNGGIYHMKEEVKIVDGEEKRTGKQIPEGSPIGYTFALSTIANIRGFDGSDIDWLIYDEFIPEPHARPIKEEHEAFLNAYETINRNRELQGRPPLQVLCLANANTLANPLFMGLNLVTKAERMYRTGQEYSVDQKRGIVLVNLCRSTISEQKSITALYRLAGNSSFSRMALSNDFSGEEERGRIGSKPLQEFRPVVAVGEICIYQHKSRDLYYCSSHVSGSPPTFGVGDVEKARLRRSYNWLWLAYLNNKMEFEERICEILLTKYFS